MLIGKIPGSSCAFVHGSSLTMLASILLATGCGDDGREIVLATEEAIGTIYQVGPTRQYTSLGQVAGLLNPGDTVEVDGNATYSGNVQLTRSGTASSKITIRGVRVGGKRPVLSGGTNTVAVNANHYIFEGFEVTGGSSRCVFHHGHDVTIRDTVVHHCPAQGILGADSDSGSLTMEYVEVYACGSGTTRHPVYIATDESAHPDSVFRMQHCYIHDGNGGNSVKSRAQRNEIYYNWIEGGVYKELELIGPDGQDEDLAREDSDVVGNVFRKTHTQYVVRIGGDGTGQTWGRYRFVNNTFLLTQGSSAAIHVFDGIESVEMHNNVFYRVGGGSVQTVRDDGAWATGSPIIHGSANSVPQGSSVPAGWMQTMIQNNPGFLDVASRDVRLSAGSPLRNAGVNVTSSPPGHPFPSPLALPLYHSPLGVIGAVGSAEPRPEDAIIDIGAYEHGGASQPPPSGGCSTAQPGVWVNNPMASQSGTFTARWDVTPSGSSIDGVLGLSLGSTSAWTGLAALVLFDVSGRILVRNGSTYQAASTYWYTGGQTYKIRMVVDIAMKKYSVYVQAPGAAEQLLASQYAFRTEQANVAALNSWVMFQAEPTGTLEACDFSLQ